MVMAKKPLEIVLTRFYLILHCAAKHKLEYGTTSHNEAVGKVFFDPVVYYI
jgi:hypothetical protein